MNTHKHRISALRIADAVQGQILVPTRMELCCEQAAGIGAGSHIRYLKTQCVS